MPKYAERNPTILKPADSKKVSHGLWRTEHQTIPLPSVAFYCPDCCAVELNRFVSRTFQLRWFRFIINIYQAISTCEFLAEYFL